MLRNYLIFFTLVIATLWLSSGTLAPYAATIDKPIAQPPCNYLLNIDHVLYESTYSFLRGEPREKWTHHSYIRRILFPLLAFPFMELTDFMSGGILLSLLLHLCSGGLFLRFIAKRYGTPVQSLAAWVLPTFPGIAYFGALPYCHAAIVPLSLLGFMALAALDESGNEIGRSIKSGLICGVLALGYDIGMFLLPAGLILLLHRRQWKAALLFALSSSAITVLNSVLLDWIYNVPVINSNTGIYLKIFGSYLNIPSVSFSRWAELIKSVPVVFLQNFFFSMFGVIPTIALIFFAISIKNKRARLTRVEASFLLAGLAVWIFNNAAPPYEGWQLRGSWIARLYEPMFIPLLVYICRTVAYQSSRLLRPLAALLVICQAVIVYGPYWGINRASDYLYWQFYRHSPPGSFTANLEKYGTYPFGTCRAQEQSGGVIANDKPSNESQVG